MKGFFHSFIFIVLFALLAINIVIFISGMALSDKMSHYEEQTNKLHRENIEFEKELYELSSLRYAASISASLDFTQKTIPTYLENLKYALNR